ncbi:MAG TPA: hypothetical protein VNX87_15165 [Candidatus Sulfotelmatobacter sp.]|nr:hypothetical protein [Candidatus Sulfotelmatobacter sp.]
MKRNESASADGTLARANQVSSMQKKVGYVIALLLMSTPLFAQTKRLWVLQSSGEMVEYDPATFAPKQRVKLPPEALKSPSNISINRQGQILFASTISLPLSESDATDPHKIWIWNGHTVASIDQGVEHKSEDHGSNQAVTESAPLPYLSEDGNHLFWFANQPRRLQREEVDLSTTVTFQAWRTDVEGKAREEVTSTKLPDCRCPTGSCDESCPSVVVWAPDGGIQNFFLTTQVVAGQTATTYKESTRYQLDGTKWAAMALPEPLQRVLDANSSGSVIVEAIPDTGCCGWSNQSNDQTLVLVDGRASTIFDEQATYKNADYDVSFFTSNARLSPDGARVAMTITATTQSNKAIQLSEQGQANPEESQLIRKALPELPAVEVKSLGDTARRLAFIPHASLVGWIDDKELLIIENHLLVAYNPGTGARRKSTVKVEDVVQVFLR